MKVKYLKEEISARGLPVSSTKEVLIERSTTALNDNAYTMHVSKTSGLLTVQRAKNNARNNGRIDAQAHEAPVNLAWILLEQYKNIATIATTKTAHDPRDPASIRSSFTQRNNHSKRRNRKSCYKK